MYIYEMKAEMFGSFWLCTTLVFKYCYMCIYNLVFRCLELCIFCICIRNEVWYLWPFVSLYYSSIQILAPHALKRAPHALKRALVFRYSYVCMFSICIYEMRPDMYGSSYLCTTLVFRCFMCVWLVYVYMKCSWFIWPFLAMGWLRLVGSLKL